MKAWLFKVVVSAVKWYCLRRFGHHEEWYVSFNNDLKWPWRWLGKKEVDIHRIWWFEMDGCEFRMLFQGYRYHVYWRTGGHGVWNEGRLQL